MPTRRYASEHDTSHSVYPPVAFFPGGSSSPLTAAQVTLLTNPATLGGMGTGFTEGTFTDGRPNELQRLARCAQPARWDVYWQR